VVEPFSSSPINLVRPSPTTSQPPTIKQGLHAWACRRLSYKPRVAVGLVVLLMFILLQCCQVIRERRQTQSDRSLGNGNIITADEDLEDLQTVIESALAVEQSNAAKAIRSGPAYTLPGPGRVFDFLMLNDELDAREIRLNELYEAVDAFYLLESSYTFSG